MNVELEKIDRRLEDCLRRQEELRSSKANKFLRFDEYDSSSSNWQHIEQIKRNNIPKLKIPRWKKFGQNQHETNRELLAIQE